MRTCVRYDTSLLPPRKSLFAAGVKGAYIDEIAEHLALPRTTIFHWVRDLPVPPSSFDPAKASAARRRAVEAIRTKHRLLRENAYSEGCEEFAALSLEPTFRDFVCLYLAEGYKRDRNRVSICNSDPPVIVLGARWINRLSARKVTYSVQYHADQDPRDLQEFWSELLEIESRRCCSSGSRTAIVSPAATGDRSMASSRSASATPTSVRGSKRGWTRCARVGPRLGATGRSSAW